MDEEGFEPPLKKPLVEEPSRLEKAWSNLYVYRGNAFLDFIYQASDQDRQWVKGIFGLGDRPSCVWDLSYDGNIARIKNGMGSVLFKVERDVPPNANIAVDPFPLLRYPWILPGDNSVSSILTRDVLTVVYGYILNPQDQYSFMCVNKLFYRAGVLWSGYQERIEKLLVRGRLDKTIYPFNNQPTFISPHQCYFALCFISCESDKKLSDKLLRAMRSGNFDHWIIYCGSILCVLHSDGHLIREGKSYSWSQARYGIGRHEVLLDDEGFYMNNSYVDHRGDYSTIPIEDLRQRTFQIILY